MKVRLGMQKFRAISLIETLISLTIVSIALIALLPVMTVRKDGNDPTRGNKYWHLHENTNDISYIEPLFQDESINVSIGNPKNPKNDDDYKDSFRVYNNGFKNKDLIPLYATDSLYWNGQYIEFFTEKSGLRIHSGDSYLTGSGYSFPSELYVDSDKIYLENNTTAGFNYANSGPYTSFEGKSGLRDSGNFYSLSNAGKEYLTVDVSNNVIGIGENAVRYYNGSNLIAIFSNTSAESASGTSTGMMGNAGGLVVGRKNGNVDNYGQPSDFVIYRPTGQTFQINSNVRAGTFVAKQLVKSSDIRLKNVISNFNKGIDSILKVNPVEYTLKDDAKQIHHVGVIAQDLRKIFPEAVIVNRATGYLMVSQEPVFYALLNSIKELNSNNINLEKENKKLEEKIANLKIIRDKLKKTSSGGDL